MDFNKTLILTTVFLLGFLCATLISFFLLYGQQISLSGNVFKLNSNHETPFDFVKDNQIQVYEDKVIINIENPTISKFDSTGSMEPILNEHSTGINIKPKSEKDIHVGDIITFTQGDELIEHRIIEIGTDNQGTYFLTKGDNSALTDKKIRFNDIKHITVAVLW